MRKQLKYLVLILTVMLFGSSVQAQQGLANINWNIGIPTGDLSDFLINEDASLGGISVDTRYVMTENLSVGWYAAWDFFNGDAEGTENFGNVDVTGQKRYFVNSFPLMVNAHYYLSQSPVKTYAGGGIGAVRTLKRTSIGTYNIQDNNWHFGLYPEIGTIIPVTNWVKMNMAARYNLAFKSDDSIAVNYLSFSIGVSYDLY